MKMPTILTLLAIATTLTIAVPAYPASTAPVTFAQFPAKVYSGPTVLPDFKGKQRAFAKLRTRLTQGFRGKPTFAGSWRVIEIGCGTGCTIVYLGDVATGNIVETELGGEEHGQLRLQHRANSRLIVATWEEDFDGEVCIRQGFALEAGRLKAASGQVKGRCPE